MSSLSLVVFPFSVYTSLITLFLLFDFNNCSKYCVLFSPSSNQAALNIILMPCREKSYGLFYLFLFSSIRSTIYLVGPTTSLLSKSLVCFSHLYFNPPYFCLFPRVCYNIFSHFYLCWYTILFSQTHTYTYPYTRTHTHTHANLHISLKLMLTTYI